MPTAIYKVQVAGRAVKLPAGVLKREFQRAGTLQLRLLEYAQVIFIQTAQTAVCNRHHGVEQQLCRWLLLSLDRAGGARLS